MMFKNVFLGAVAASAIMGGSAIAAVVGIESDCGIGGTGTGLGGSSVCYVDSSRDNTDAIEVSEDGSIVGDNDFFSLGLGGSLVFQFDPAFTGPAMVVEITNGRATSSHKEAVKIFGSNDGINFDELGIATNQVGTDDGTRGTKTTVSFSGVYEYLGFLDVTKSVFAASRSTDGYDIDAISVNSVPSPVPLPASALLLLAGVGGLGAMRARRKS